MQHFYLKLCIEIRIISIGNLIEICKIIIGLWKITTEICIFSFEIQFSEMQFQFSIGHWTLILYLSKRKYN